MRERYARGAEVGRLERSRCATSRRLERSQLDGGRRPVWGQHGAAIEGGHMRAQHLRSPRVAVASRGKRAR
jgi:hypothetical protein